jgi:hypothetical protein
MLKQYDFAFSSHGAEKIYSDMAVKIHGVLMHSIPNESAEKMHEKKYHPFSIFCIPSEDNNNIITRVSSLDRSGDIIVETAAKLDSMIIKGMGEVRLIRNNEISGGDLSGLVEEIKGRKFRLIFLTPSVFKTAGKETSFPDVTMHFLSVIRRMNEFEENECIDFDEFRKAFYKCRIGEWQFNSHVYNVSGIHIPGMTGYVDIELPDGAEQILLKKVFTYASFSGTGGRTGMGMGGFFFRRR